MKIKVVTIRLEVQIQEVIQKIEEIQAEAKAIKEEIEEVRVFI